MRRALALAGATLAVVAGAQAAQAPAVTRVAKPAFPPPLERVVPSGPLRLTLFSTVPRAPTYKAPRPIPVPVGAPGVLGGERTSNVLAQPGTTFVVYGDTTLAGIGPRGGVKYAFDLRSLAAPPQSVARTAYPQEITWARQLDRLLLVQTNHSGYASDSGGRNGYLTGIDLDTGRVRWRSPSLVANARTFVVTRGLIVSGYGFTAEKDWLYLVDPATGRVRDRLALPSMAERIALRNGRIVVRCYDAWVVARAVPS
jgi:hypothetical protein